MEYHFIHRKNFQQYVKQNIILYGLVYKCGGEQGKKIADGIGEMNGVGEKKKMKVRRRRQNGIPWEMVYAHRGDA